MSILAYIYAILRLLYFERDAFDELKRVVDTGIHFLVSLLIMMSKSLKKYKQLWLNKKYCLAEADSKKYHLTLT
jgi:hypothetical protein